MSASGKETLFTVRTDSNTSTTGTRLQRRARVVGLSAHPENRLCCFVVWKAVTN